MDKCFFLIVTDDSSEILHHSTAANQFLQDFHCSSQSNSVTYIIVPSWSNFIQFRDEFPGLNCILLNIGKDEATDKNILTTLPEMECIIDFTVKLDNQMLGWVDEFKITSKVSLKMKHVNISKLNELLNGRDAATPILITVLPPKTKTNFVKEAAKSVKKKGEKVKNELKPDLKQQQSIQFQPNHLWRAADAPRPSSSIASSLTRVEDLLSKIEKKSNSTSSRNQERTPLLNNRVRQEETLPEDTFSQLISWLYSYCCCCFSEPLTLPQFYNYAHLQNYVRGKKHEYIRKKLNTVFEDAEENWGRILRQIDSQKEAEVGLLRAEYNEKKQQRLSKYHEVCAKNKENAPTLDILVKSAARREQSELDKLKWIERDLAKDIQGLEGKYEGMKEGDAKDQHYNEGCAIRTSDTPTC